MANTRQESTAQVHQKWIGNVSKKDFLILKKKEKKKVQKHLPGMTSWKSSHIIEHTNISSADQRLHPADRYSASAGSVCLEHQKETGMFPWPWSLHG